MIIFKQKAMRQILVLSLLIGLCATLSAQKKDDRTEIEKVQAKAELFFDIEQDRFHELKPMVYKPRYRPPNHRTNAIYCYFHTTSGHPYGLYLRIQHKNRGEWLFIAEYVLLLDDEVFRIDPEGRIKTDVLVNENGAFTFEWIDISLGSSDSKLIDALAAAENIEIKFNGKEFYDTWKSSKQDATVIRETIDFYRKLGGEL